VITQQTKLYSLKVFISMCNTNIPGTEILWWK